MKHSLQSLLLYLAISLLAFIECTNIRDKNYVLENTFNPLIRKLVFEKDNGFDEYYNIFGKVPFKTPQIDTNLNIFIYESLDKTVRLSLPEKWIIQDSERLVLSSVANCNRCYFSILQHDSQESNMDLDQYLTVLIKTLQNDTTTIQENLKIEQFPALEIDHYHISGNQIEQGNLIDFESRIVFYKGKIYDITLSQTENTLTAFNKNIFELVFYSLVIDQRKLIPKEIDSKFTIRYERN